MNERPNLPLDLRVGAGFEVGWEFNIVSALTWRRWALTCEIDCSRESKGFRCFWPRFFVRVLGFYVGAGFCYFPQRPEPQGKDTKGQSDGQQPNMTTTNADPEQ